jgi:drug/metabolite transporter (DMT)-like permease
VGLSLGGAFLVVGGMAAFATPPSAADLLAVTAGLAFSGNNILARKAQDIPASSKTVGLLLGCGVTSALMLGAMAWFGEAPQATQFAAGFSWHIVLLLAAFSLFWLALVSFTWQWSVTRLEAGRSGVIAIAELVVALVSATLTGYETMTLLECIGAALIACAAVLEATDNPTDCATPLSTTSVIKDTA